MIAGDLARDFYFGGRALRRQPGFTLVAVLTLAIGIGANAAVFTIVDALLWHRLPVRAPNELVLFSDSLFTGTSTGDPPLGTWNLFSSDIYRSFRSAHLPLSGIAATASGSDPAALRLPGRPDRDATPAARARVQLVSGNYFDVMGAAVAAGRTLAPADDAPGAPPAAVVSDRFWRGTLGADPLAVGRVVTLSGTSFTVVGITQPEFFGERVRQAPDVWVPLAFQPQIQQRPSWAAREDAYWLNLIGRLAPGASRDSATTAVTATLRQYLAAHSGRGGESARRIIDEARVDLADGSGGLSDARQRYGQPSTILLGIVGLMLLIACANVGNLLVARSVTRRQELALRAALGAGRRRIARQLLTESALLGVGGAALGSLFAVAAVRALAAAAPVALPRLEHVAVDARVLLFTGAVAMITAVAFGLLPAWRGAAADGRESLASGGRGRVAGASRTRAVLVVADLALAMVLLAGAGLMLRTVAALAVADPGFTADRVLSAQFSLVGEAYAEDAAVRAFQSQLLQKLRAIPGVATAALADQIPFGGNDDCRGFHAVGHMKANPEEDPCIERYGVTPEYRRLMNVPLVAGRDLLESDTDTAQPVILISQATARAVFGFDNPLGAQVRMGSATRGPWATIVGIVGDVHHADVTAPVTAAMYVPEQQLTDSFLVAVVKTTGRDATTVAGPVRAAIRELDPKVPITQVAVVPDLVAGAAASQLFVTRLLAAFAAMAVLLAALGLYGLVSYGVTQRTREVGLRMALGARRGDVLRLVLASGASLVFAGVAVGLGAASLTTRFLGALVFGVSPVDPLTFAAAAALLCVVALIAHWLPLRRALRIDPAIALRSE